KASELKREFLDRDQPEPRGTHDWLMTEPKHRFGEGADLWVLQVIGAYDSVPGCRLRGEDDDRELGIVESTLNLTRTDLGQQLGLCLDELVPDTIERSEILWPYRATKKPIGGPELAAHRRLYDIW